MTLLLYLLLAVLIFGVLIFVHELGHFLLAKATGVRVNEFSVCMGPALWQRQWGETTYSLRCIPAGGYCAMEGEDGDSDDPHAFSAVAPWRRLAILLAGSAFNFLCGFLILLVVYAGAEAVALPRISGFFPGSTVAEETGLQAGDTILAVNGERVYLHSDLALLLDRDTDGIVALTVERAGERVELGAVPLSRKPYGNALQYGLYLDAAKMTPALTVKTAWVAALDFSRLVRLGLEDLLRGAVSVRELSGPVGIVSTIVETGEDADTLSDAAFSIAMLAAFLAVNLAVMNLLPLPALDGGRAVCLLLTVLVEAVTGRKLDPKYEKRLHTAGMFLLFGFLILITFKDILQIFA